MAMMLAIAADALQLIALPLFVEGAESPADDILDLGIGVAMVALLGWHWEFLPSFLAKLVPLIHVDTELGAKDLLNNRMAYVAISRGAYDAQIFTNDREKLGAALGHDVSHSSAHVPEMKQEQAVTPQREIAPKQEQGEDFGLGL
jgi:hypothetical protein